MTEYNAKNIQHAPRLPLYASQKDKFAPNLPKDSTPNKAGPIKQMQLWHGSYH